MKDMVVNSRIRAAMEVWEKRREKEKIEDKGDYEKGVKRRELKERGRIKRDKNNWKKKERIKEKKRWKPISRVELGKELKCLKSWEERV